MTPETFATLERLVELRRQKEALALAHLRRALQDRADAAAAARQAASPPPPGPGPVAEGHYRALAALQRWEAARQRVLAAEADALTAQLPAAEARLRTARATVQAMDLLGQRVARAAALRRARKQDLANAAEAANRPQ